MSSLSAPSRELEYGDVEFIDDIIKIEIITGDNRKTQKFFRELKERLKRLLKQIDTLITVQDIRTI